MNLKQQCREIAVITTIRLQRDFYDIILLGDNDIL